MASDQNTSTNISYSFQPFHLSIVTCSRFYFGQQYFRFRIDEMTSLLPFFQTHSIHTCKVAVKSIVVLTNELIKRISISIIINSFIILELVNSVTLSNELSICSPSSVSDGMSNSNSIINQHYLISLCLYNRNWHHIL